MKNKGFTLVEIIISLVILVGIGLVVGIGLNKILNKSGIEDYDVLVDKITSSADVYLSNNSTLTTDLYSNRGFIMITLEELINEGLLDNDLVNPQTGEKIKSDELVMVSLDENGSLIFTYPAEANKGDYLQTINKIIQYDEEFKCLDPNDLDTINLGYIKKDGYLQKPYFKDAAGNIINDRITCLTPTIDTTKLGVYPVKYSYVTPDGVTKQATRNYIVQDTIPPIVENFTSSVSTLGTNNWYTALTRKSVIKDNESGILKVEYCISTSTSCNPTTTFPQSGTLKTLNFSAQFTSKSSAQYLCVKATDMAGNATTKCDSGFKVDTTAPTSGSIKFSSILREWAITTATDTESSIAKYECKYGTSPSNLNQTVTASGTKCVMPKGSFTPGTTYYVKLVITNGAGLKSETGVVSGTWTYTVADAYSDNCGSSSYCPNAAFFTKYGNYNFVVYSKKNNSYRAILNGLYKQTAYWVSSCDGRYLVSENFAQIYNTTLNNQFYSALPSNRSSILAVTSWCTGDLSLNSGCNTKMTSLVGLASVADFNQMKNNANFRAGAGSSLWWLSNYSTQVIQIEQIKEDKSDDDTIKTTSTFIDTRVYSYYSAQNTTAALRSTSSDSTWARPAIEFKKTTKICSGNGSSSSPYSIC